MDLTPAAPPTSTTSPLPISSSINPLISKSPNSPSGTDNNPNLLPTHLHKSLSLSNGVRRRLHHHPQEPPTMVVCSYKECLKNHAATMGGLALDGCGEFFPSPNSSPLDPTSLKCAACGCHRNFHRREPSSSAVVHHHYHPLPAIQWTNHNNNSSSPSTSPSPSSPAASPTPHHSIYPPPPPSSAPHMLLALSEMNHHRPPPPYHGGGGGGRNPAELVMMSSNSSGRKRARTKFTSEQKVKMHDFAESLGWKMVRANEDKIVENFCSEIGVRRNVFKVWMHNNKHRKDKISGGGGGGLTTGAAGINGKILNNNGGHHLHHHHEEQHFDDEGDEDEEDEEEEDELGDDSSTVVNNVVKYDLNGSGGNYSEGGRVRFDTNVFDSKVHVLHASNSAVAATVAGSAMSP